MRLTLKKWRVLILLSIMSFLAGGCTGQTLPVTVEAAETVLSLGEHTSIECIVSNSTGNFTYEWLCDGGSIQGEGEFADWFADTAGNYTVRVKVEGDDGERGAASLTITVIENHIPVIEDLVLTPKNPKYFKDKRILRGQSCEIECVARDEDGDELAYTWSCDNGKISGTGAKVTWTAPSKKCDATIMVMVADDSGEVTTESVVFKVETCGCAFR